MRVAQYPLYSAFPALFDSLPLIKIGDLPTPVHALEGLPNAWIKRDDLTGRDYGGNKIRKLEFVLADILAQKKKHVVTFGATGTNAGVATALMCKQAGLSCTVLLFDQPDSPTVQKNYALMQRFGANLIHCKTLFRTALAFYLHPARLFGQTYFLYAGCSNPVATFGYINAAFELKQQIEAGQCPSPSQIYVAVSSSSTLAGLTLGCQLAGLPTEVIGIRVAPAKVGPFDACTVAVVNKQMEQAQLFLRQHVPEFLVQPLPRAILLGDYFGDGYGVASQVALQAMQQFQTKFAIPLDQTYSGKAAAAFLNALKNATAPILFWTTYNSRVL